MNIPSYLYTTVVFILFGILFVIAGLLSQHNKVPEVLQRCLVVFVLTGVLTVLMIGLVVFYVALGG